jgi:protein-disulfide isomerase
MSTTPRCVIGSLACLFALAACSQNKPAAQAACASEDPTMVVATAKGKTVTLKEVDELLGKELKELEKQKFQMRAGAAEQIVVTALVKEEAAKAGKTEDEWFRSQVEGKVQDPPDAEIQKVWDEAKDKMPPGATFEQMKPQIIAFITKDKRREVAMQFQADLKKQAGFELKIAPPPEPRIQVEAKGPAKGPEGAKITIVEFSDFQCPYCSRAEGTVDQVMTEYAGKVRLVYRHYPLPFHDHAEKAAEAAACANEQGKFWDMHKQLFANQQKLAIEDLKAHAGAIGLDAGKFAECLDQGKMKATVDADQEAGKKAGVNGTPAFFINGILLSGAQPIAEFERIINQELAAAK